MVSDSRLDDRDQCPGKHKSAESPFSSVQSSSTRSRGDPSPNPLVSTSIGYYSSAIVAFVAFQRATNPFTCHRRDEAVVNDLNWRKLSSSAFDSIPLVLVSARLRAAIEVYRDSFSSSSRKHDGTWNIYFPQQKETFTSEYLISSDINDIL